MRDSLNSRILKERFPEVYKKFFSKCQLVVSAPHFFTWAGEYVAYWGGIAILQKTPLRIYLGLELSPVSSNRGNIIIENDIVSYSIKEDKFKPDQYEHSAQERLLDFLNDTEPSFKIEKQTLKIHILSELPLRATGSTTAMSSALAVLLFLQSQVLKPNDIKGWKDSFSSDLIQNNKFKFDSVFRLAWKILAAFRGEYASGTAVFAVLLPSFLPVFYCMAGKKNLNLPIEVETNYDILEKVPVFGGRVEELFHLKKIPSWPIDFALISLGESRGVSSFSTQKLQDIFREANKFVDKDFKKFFNLKKELKPFFCRKNDIWQANLQVMNALNIRILMKMGELLKSGQREDILRDFLRAIDKHQILFLLLGVNPLQINIANSIIHQEASKVDDLGAGVKSASTTKKDIILVAVPAGRMSKIIERAALRIKKELNLELQIIYASWLDGIEQEGIKIEQDLERKIYSGFISENTVYVRDFSQKNPVNLLLSSEEFNKRKKEIDLLLIEEEGKIYIKGKPLTSKELHSKKATIKLLKILLEKRGQEVLNSELPRSSYSQDRYELQGKIIIPLIKAIEKRTKKKLDFKISGGIINFSLKLNPNLVKIWLVKNS